MARLSESFVSRFRRSFNVPEDTPITPGTNVRALIGERQKETLRKIQQDLASQMRVQEDADAWFWGIMDCSGGKTNKKYGRPGTVRRLASVLKRCEEEGMPDNGSD